jgi:hypothetical protein
MKKVMAIAGQNDETYGQRLTYRKVRDILTEKNIECVYPKFSFQMMAVMPFYDGLIVSGRLENFFESIAIIDLALEFRKPVFFFGVNLEGMKRNLLDHVSTELMSPFLTGFVTDEVAAKWASLWSPSKIEAGVDIANVYLLEKAEYEKGKFAVFAPSQSGILKYSPDQEWFLHMDSRIIVEDPKDSKIAVKFAQKIKSDDVALIFKIEDIMDAVKNAKFVLSEKFYTSLTAIAFETPFLHVDRKALRYFGKELSDDVCNGEDTDLALAFSKINEFDLSKVQNFNSMIKERYKRMNLALDEFINAL